MIFLLILKRPRARTKFQNSIFSETDREATNLPPVLLASELKSGHVLFPASVFNVDASSFHLYRIS